MRPPARRGIPRLVVRVLLIWVTLAGASCVRLGFDRSDETPADAAASPEVDGNADGETDAPLDAFSILTDRTWTAGSTGCDLAKTFVVDQQGRTYLAGAFEQSLDLGCGPAVTSKGGRDAFIVQIAAGGACGWLKTFGGAGDDVVQALAIDGAALIAAGDVQETVVFADPAESHTVPADRVKDSFVMRLDTAGAHRWTRAQPGTTASDYEFVTGDMELVGSAIYATGRFGGKDLVFGHGGTSDTLSDNGWGDIFLTKLSIDGGYLWTRSLGGAGSDRGYALASDPQGYLYLAGNFRGSVDFDLGAGQSVQSGNHDGFVMRQTPNDAFDWVMVTTVNGWAPRKAVAPAPDGSAAVAGTSYETGAAAATIEKLSGDGSVVWRHTIFPDAAGPGDIVETDKSPRAAVDAAGTIYLAGVFKGTLDFDPSGGEDKQQARGGQDIFISAYRADGTYLRTLILGGTGDEHVEEIGAIGVGELLVAGSFSGTVDFGAAGSPDQRTSKGCTDIFVTRVKP